MDLSWLHCQITYWNLWIYLGYYARSFIGIYGFILAAMPDYFIGLMDLIKYIPLVRGKLKKKLFDEITIQVS